MAGATHPSTCERCSFSAWEGLERADRVCLGRQRAGAYSDGEQVCKRYVLLRLLVDGPLDLGPETADMTAALRELRSYACGNNAAS